MYIPGRLAVGYLASAAVARFRHRSPRIRTEILPALVGALTPDLVDKVLYLLELYEHSRAAGHSAFILLGLTLGWLVLRRLGIRWALPFGMWVLGIASHFAADLANDLIGGLSHHSRAFSTWFAWPLMTPSDWEFRFDSTLLPDLYGVTVLEIMAVALAAALAVRMHWAGPARKASS